MARTARGKSEEEAVAELELLRAGRSLNQLVDDLKQRRQRQAAVAVAVVGGEQRSLEQRADRGQRYRGRYGRWGRGGGPPSRRARS